MRYPPDQKARARDALLRAGARSLKTSGFNGIGVDGLAAAAGEHLALSTQTSRAKKPCSRPSSTPRWASRS